MGLRERFVKWLISHQHPDEFMRGAAIEYTTGAGLNINEQSALTITGFWAGVRVIAESVSTLPLHLYRRGGAFRAKATDHPLYAVLHDRPNHLMSSVVFRESLQAHLLTWGNAYAEIIRVGPRSRREVRALRPLCPNHVSPDIDGSGDVFYWHEPEQGEKRRLAADDVLHIPGLGFDGLKGYSPVAMHREALGLAKVTEKFGSSYFGRGSRPGLILKTQRSISPEAAKRLKASVEAAHKGVGNSHGVMVLEDGLEAQTWSIPPDDAQFLETREFQLAEVARILRIPPSLIGASGGDSLTYSNRVDDAQAFVTHSLRPWLVKWEQEINRKLLREDERGDYYAEHSVDALLRGNTKERYDAYAVAIASKFMTRNEARERENLPPLEGGDDFPEPPAMPPEQEVTDEQE